MELKAEDVRDCLMMLNELICMYDNPHLMLAEEH
jgi:hypothetical protein